MIKMGLVPCYVHIKMMLYSSQLITSINFTFKVSMLAHNVVINYHPILAPFNFEVNCQESHRLID